MVNDIDYASAGIEYGLQSLNNSGIKNASIDQKNVKQKKAPGNFNLYLFCMAVLFSMYDTISTTLSIRVVGYSYEGNIILREIIHNTGILGFAGVKLGATLLALFTVYYIIENRNNFGWRSIKMFYGIYIGTIISSFFAATSNLAVVYTGSSFYLLGLNSLEVSIALLLMAPLSGFLLDATEARKKMRMQLGPRKEVITRSANILTICMNHLNPFRYAGRSIAKK